MTLQIGDFVWQDYCVTRVDNGEPDGSFKGKAIGAALMNYKYYPHDIAHMDWWIAKDTPLITLENLREIADMINNKHPLLAEPEVKKWMQDLSQFLLRRFDLSINIC